MKKQSNKYVLYLQDNAQHIHGFRIACRDVFVLKKATREIHNLFMPGAKVAVIDPNGGVLIANYVVSSIRATSIDGIERELTISIMDPRSSR